MAERTETEVETPTTSPRRLRLLPIRPPRPSASPPPEYRRPRLLPGKSARAPFAHHRGDHASSSAEFSPGAIFRATNRPTMLRSTATCMPLSARISGYVPKVNVDDNQFVHKGDVLVEIDPRDYQTALDQASANLASAEATARSLNINIPVTSVNTTSQVSSSQADIDDAQAGIVAALQQHDAAQAQLLEAQANNAESPKRPGALQAPGRQAGNLRSSSTTRQWPPRRLAMRVWPRQRRTLLPPTSRSRRLARVSRRPRPLTALRRPALSRSPRPQLALFPPKPTCRKSKPRSSKPN